MANDKGIYSILHKFYVPIAILYMTVSLLEHFWHVRHYLTVWWIPAVLFVINALFGLGVWIRRKHSPTAEKGWERPVLLAIGFFSLGLTVWNYYQEIRVPDVTWKRVTARTPDEPHTTFLNEIKRGLVPLESLMSPQDRRQLLDARKKNGYQDGNGTLAGANLRIFESNQISRCPRAVVVRDNISVFLGVYLIRDEQAPNQRLATVGRRTELPKFEDQHSEYRLVVILFALDEATDKQMALDDFKPESTYELIWKE